MLSTIEQIRTALASAYPITLLVSPEEDRQEKLLRRFAASAKPAELPVIVWNCVDGFIGHGGEVHRDPMKALAWIASEGPKGLYLLKDFEDLRRGLRDTAMKIRNTGRFLFLLQQNAELPESIKPMTYVVLSMFPDDGELKALVTPLLDGKSTDGTAINRLIDSLKGMSLTEVEHLLRRGLDQLKEWVGERSSLFSPEARSQNLPRPRGVLLMGISGCGKSLATKIIAREWKLPLFRLDMNLVFAGVQGSAEWIFHRALEAVETVAPAVLWIDEIEMGIAGYHEGETGSNTRIFSTFLTWMQEHRADVFVAATANRINLLPAEILRKGRFDQVFFVDLPNDEERKEIMSIHLAMNGLDPATYDLILLASATRTWNGAEIEQAVKSAVITGHAKGEEVSQNDMLAAFGKIIPLARTMDEQLKAIRSWARTRALPATKVVKPEM
jgi:hypothetical protein